MAILSESEVKERAAEYLDSDHINNPHETTTKAEDLYDFLDWNPPSYTKGKPVYWGEWKEFRSIDSEAGDEAIREMSRDPLNYYVQRSETDPDYWGALILIITKALSASSDLKRHSVVDDPHLCTWLVDVLVGERTAPPRKPGNRTRKYFQRDDCIYFAMEALCQDGSMIQSAAAEWIAAKINLSKESIITIYRKACNS